MEGLLSTGPTPSSLLISYHFCPKWQTFLNIEENIEEAAKNSILEPRFSVSMSCVCYYQATPLDSETGSTGEFWSMTIFLKA